MTVKILSNCRGHSGHLDAGAILDLPDDEARQLIALGRAVPSAPAPQPAPEPEPEPGPVEEPEPEPEPQPKRKKA